MIKLLDKTVGEIVADDFRTAKVFERYGIDFCCAGNTSFRQACTDRNLDISRLTDELQAVKTGTADRCEDFSSWDLSRLADYIVKVHHGYLNGNMGTIAAYADKIAEVHGRNHPELREIASLFRKLSEDMTAHLKTEENSFFPAIRRIESALKKGAAPSSEDMKMLAAAIEGLHSEHEEVGDAVHAIRRLSANFALPADACNTFALTYHKLQEFEADLHKHVHLENNILFPRASALSVAA